MDLLLVILAAVVTAGGVTAVSATTPRTAVLGVAIALLGSAFVADPMPGLLGLAIRVVGTVLATYLLWVALRRAPASVTGHAIAWQGAIAIAIFTFMAGYLAAGSLGAALASGSSEGPGLGVYGLMLARASVAARSAFAAGLTLIVLSLAPVLMARDALRLGAGLLVLLAAGTLIRNALAGTGSNTMELGMALLTATAGAGVAGVLHAGLHRTGDLHLDDGLRREPVVHHRTLDDAHREEVTAGSHRPAAEPAAAATPARTPRPVPSLRGLAGSLKAPSWLPRPGASAGTTPGARIRLTAWIRRVTSAAAKPAKPAGPGRAGRDAQAPAPGKAAFPAPRSSGQRTPTRPAAGPAPRPQSQPRPQSRPRPRPRPGDGAGDGGAS